MQTDDRYVRPRRAEKKMKLAQGMRQTVYLYGAAGYGKTALVSDLLRRRPYHYYSARETGADYIRAEEELSEGGRDRIVVIDDLHMVTGRGQREGYAGLLRELDRNRGIWLILISRCRIPAWLVPLHMEATFYVIDESDLRLDRKGQDTFFERWGVSLPSNTADRIWQLAGGNPPFLRFAALEQGNMEQAVQNMWEYLTHIYEQWDPELQEFMREMSVVERFDVRMAQMVTGRGDAFRLIKKAQETGNFLVEKNGMYEYNYILRGLALSYVKKKFASGQSERIYYNAGRMYEMCNDIPNALKMYEAGGNTESIMRLLVSNARQNPAGGHYFELRRYYLTLPEEAIRTSPVLMAGMSMLQSMLLNREESERWYQMLERFAAESEGSMRREAKNRLLYLDIGLPHRGTAQMLDILKHAASLLRNGKADLPEFSVTSNLPSLMNGGKDFCEWSRRDKELAASVGRLVEFVLGKYGKGLVSTALAESYLEKGEDNLTVMSLAEKGRMQAEAGGKLEQVFVTVGILVWLSVIGGRAEDGQDILTGFRKKAEQEAPWLLANMDAFSCRIFLYQGKTAQVMEWMEKTPDENEDFCSLERFRYLTRIRAYLQFGKYEKAYGLLQKMLYYAREQKRDYIVMESQLLLAVTRYRMKEKGWEKPLQECITNAESYHFVRIFSREGGAVLKLLREGEFLWREENFRRQVIRECEQMEKYYPSYLRAKPDGDVVLSFNALNILRLQAEGYRTDQIAEMLDITGNTVKYHSKETYRKLGVSSRAAAVNEAKNRGLI